MRHENITFGFGFLTNFKDFKKIIYDIYSNEIDVNIDFTENYLQYNFDFGDICYKIMNKYSYIHNLELIYNLPLDDKYLFIVYKLYSNNSENKNSKIQEIITEDMKKIADINKDILYNFLKEIKTDDKKVGWYIMNNC